MYCKLSALITLQNDNILAVIGPNLAVLGTARLTALGLNHPLTIKAWKCKSGSCHILYCGLTGHG